MWWTYQRQTCRVYGSVISDYSLVLAGAMCLDDSALTNIYNTDIFVHETALYHYQYALTIEGLRLDCTMWHVKCGLRFNVVIARLGCVG